MIARANAARAAADVELRLHVHLAQLDGAEPRLRPRVPPHHRVVRRPSARAHGVEAVQVLVPRLAAPAGCRGPGYARITAARELAMPESVPNQYGELAPSAWSSGSRSRMPFIAATAASVSGTPTCT